MECCQTALQYGTYLQIITTPEAPGLARICPRAVSLGGLRAARPRMATANLLFAFAIFDTFFHYFTIPESNLPSTP